MSLVTAVWSTIAGACLTLAALHLPARWRNREANASLAFAVAAACTAALAFAELAMMHAQTPAAYLAALKWANLAVTVLLVALTALAYFHLGAGRPWLALAGLALRLISTPFGFVDGQTLDYREISALRQTPLLGEQVSVAAGVPNPGMLLGQLGVLLLVAFVVDASVAAWRRGQRGAALGVGGSITCFMVAGTGQAMLVSWGAVELPTTTSLFSFGVLGVIGCVMSLDLARGRQVALELRQREQEAVMAADATQLGTWTRDLAHDVIRASDQWRELFGFEPDARLDLERVQQRIHPDDRAAFGNGSLFPVPDQGDHHSEFRVVLPDGRTRWIAHQGRAELDARGQPVRTHGTSIDITSRKQAEQEMLRLRQEIAHVGRVSVMGQLASALAHEINQPLGAILRNAEAAALFMQDPSPDLAEISAILDDIRKDDQRASAVIDRMRALLRRQTVDMVPIGVAQVLGDVATLLRPDAAARHVKLELHVPGDVPPVLGDRVQLQQVLLNLILNGMEALEGVEAANRRVRVTAHRAAAQVHVCVSDTGHGIAAADLEHIFDPFFSTKPKGIGIGLSISRGIVESHRGRLWAENNADGGANFCFTLPVAG